MYESMSAVVWNTTWVSLVSYPIYSWSHQGKSVSKTSPKTPNYSKYRVEAENEVALQEGFFYQYPPRVVDPRLLRYLSFHGS